jgi:hypothetical protein
MRCFILQNTKELLQTMNDLPGDSRWFLGPGKPE